eukprot:TRINITY_DN8703_c1_g1_i1.p1 TRINITY_DN8703_c1_g1~~TRINITY_DN8703_c1_g1_i1.p1  ORF type:complete len:160 (+),score=45.73 TRINITY_DN8703_c1_g1_i1:73-480(+)
MGVSGSHFKRPEPQAQPIFYSEEFMQKYATSKLPQPPAPEVPEVPAAAPAPPAPDPADLRSAERSRILAQLREEELTAAEASARRIASWVEEQRSRVVPCQAEQLEVERCYASPPGGDQLRCGRVVDAFAKCARL